MIKQDLILGYLQDTLNTKAQLKANNGEKHVKLMQVKRKMEWLK